MKMRISLIGAGRVAHHLAKALMSQHEIINIYSRSFDKAADLAQVAHAKAVSHFKQLNVDVDLVMIAVSDQSIPNVISALTEYLPNVLIVQLQGVQLFQFCRRNMHVQEFFIPYRPLA